MAMVPNAQDMRWDSDRERWEYRPKYEMDAKAWDMYGDEIEEMEHVWNNPDECWPPNWSNLWEDGAGQKERP